MQEVGGLKPTSVSLSKALYSQKNSTQEVVVPFQHYWGIFNLNKNKQTNKEDISKEQLLKSLIGVLIKLLAL